MTNKEEGNNLVQIPLRINLETMEEDGITKKDLKYVRIGGRKYPCIMAWVPEDIAKEYMKMEWADVKAEERDNRCLIWKPEVAGFIRCPECNRCCNCEKVRSFDFRTNLPVSMDAKVDEDAPDYEIEAPKSSEDEKDMYQEILEQLIKELSRKKPKYGQILRELYEGNMKPINIAKKLNLPISSIYDDVPKVQKMAQELYKKYM